MLSSSFANNRYSPLPRAEVHAPPATAMNTARDDREWVSPIPVDAPLPKSRHGELGEPSARWVYRSPTGDVLHYVCRFDPPGRKKEFRALSLWRKPNGRLHWEWLAPPAPRALYNLHKIAKNPTAALVVCEGEKSADAAERIFPESVVIASMNGKDGAEKADWSPLAGRTILIWPDLDDAGAKYAATVARILADLGCEVKIIDAARLCSTAPDGGTREPIEKWDAADAITEWSDVGALCKAAVALARPYNAAASASAPEGDGLKVEEVATVELNPVTSDKAEIGRLAALDPISYDRAREAAAEALKVRISTLDKLVTARREENAAKKTAELCRDIEPWPEPVNVAEALDDIRRTISRFIVCEPATATAATLWIAFTWAIEHVQVAPLAIISAPEKRCGKTQLLDLIGRLARRNLRASNISPAALFRVIEAQSPTLLIDEADAFLRENEELRGIINSGHTRQSAFVIRTVGEEFEVKQFSTWAAKAIAGIGKLADTIMDRAIVLTLRRKLPDETIERLRYARPGLFEALAAKLARFGDDYGAAIGRARPEIPEALNDRAQDNWEPLIAIADLAGAHWPKDARRAALAISGDGKDGHSTGEELLSDIRDIFDADNTGRISMAELVKRLTEDEMAPWATYNRGKPITPRQLGKRLGEFGIKAKAIHVSHYEKPKGFLRSQFADAWSRYLDSSSENGRAADDTLAPDTPPGPVTRSPSNESGDLPVTEGVTERTQSGHQGGQAPAQAEVTDTEGDQTAEIRSPEKPLYSRQGDRVTDGAPLQEQEASDDWREVNRRRSETIGEVLPQ